MYGRNLRIAAVIAMFCPMVAAQAHPLAAAAEASRVHSACPHARANAARWAKPASTTAATVANKAPIQVSAGGSSINVRRFVPDLLP